MRRRVDNNYVRGNMSVPVVSHQICPDVQRVPPVSMTSGLRKESGSVFSAHSFQGFRQIVEAPLSLLELEQSQLSQTLFIRENLQFLSALWLSIVLSPVALLCAIWQVESM